MVFRLQHATVRMRRLSIWVHLNVPDVDELLSKD